METRRKATSKTPISNNASGQDCLAPKVVTIQSKLKFNAKEESKTLPKVRQSSDDRIS
jgi:hypothetical protein